MSSRSLLYAAVVTDQFHLIALGIGHTNSKVVTAHGVFSAREVSDTVLGRSLPALENGYANVYETRLHYVAGRVIEAMTIRFGRRNPRNASG